jgi:hypothetical protein
MAVRVAATIRPRAALSVRFILGSSGRRDGVQTVRALSVKRVY